MKKKVKDLLESPLLIGAARFALLALIAALFVLCGTISADDALRILRGQ